MNIAIIGAGWAGLAAALQAADLGVRVTVFEAGHTLGGRARQVQSKRLNTVIDNGQHILLGAYTDTLALMNRLGLNQNQSFVREPLNIESANGNFKLKLTKKRAPLHLLAGLASAKGISWTEKWRMIAAINALKKHQWQVKANISVADWLAKQRQSINICKNFWYPLCVAAMNTPPEVACAQIFANVLRDSLGGNAQVSDTLIPKVDLSNLWPNQVSKANFASPSGNITINCGATVRNIEVTPNTVTTGTQPRIQIQNQEFDGVILACNAPSAVRLLENLNTENNDFIDKLQRFYHIPIATLTLQLEQPWHLPQPMYMLNEHRARGHYGQWLFNCAAFLTDSANHNLINIVISDANEAIHRGEQYLADAVCKQLNEQTARFGAMPKVTKYELIVEKRATFACTPGLIRPEVHTPWPNIFIAGDYTNTGYPAVLEGAVRSGREAALQLYKNHNK